MGDMEQEILTASKRFNDRIEQLLRFSIQQSNRKESTETLLARELCEIMKSHGEVWSANIPIEDTSIMKIYLNSHGIPYAFTNGINGMNTLMVDKSHMDEVFDFHCKIKQLSASNSKIANAKEWFDVERSIGETKCVIYKYKEQKSGVLSDRDRFNLKYIERKLYGDGDGYSYIYSRNITQLNDKNEITSMSPIIATRLAGAVNNDINKPDLLQAIAETSFSSENVAKMISEDTREKVLDRELNKFAESVKYGNSIYLADVFHSNKSYLLFNSEQNMIGRYVPETETVKCIVSSKELNRLKEDCLKNNKNFNQELSNILSGHASQMKNLKCMNSGEKNEYDLMRDDEIKEMKKNLLNKLSTAIDKSSEEGSSFASEKVEKWLTKTEQDIIDEFEAQGKVRDIDYNDDSIVEEIEKKKMEDPDAPKELYEMNYFSLKEYLKDIKTDDFDYVPDVNNREFNQMIINRVKDKERNMEDPNLTLFAGFAMNIMEEVYSSRISSYVNSMQQKDVNLPTDVKLNNLYQTLLKDLDNEEGAFKDFSDPELFISSAKNMHPELSEDDIEMFRGIELDQLKETVRSHLRDNIKSCHVVETKSLQDIFKASDNLESKVIEEPTKEMTTDKEHTERVE